MADFSVVQNLPDIDFVDTSVSDLLSAAITAYQDTYFNLTGQTVTVQPGDDAYILIYAEALRQYSVLQTINQTAKMNFLKYATGPFLDQLGANTGNVRGVASSAVTTLLFSIAIAQTSIITIPQGTRVTAGDGVYFATVATVQMLIGSTSASVAATCTTTGTVGDGYVAGQLTTIVDSIPATTAVSVTNTDINGTAGGAPVQDDLSFAEQIFASPSGYSVAGPESAYEYFARAYSSSVIDAKAVSTSAGCVTLYVLLTGGTLPNSTFLSEMATYFAEFAPDTDNLTLSAPTVSHYNINLTYYIDSANAANAATIEAAVSAAVSAYTAGTQLKMDLAIIPDDLTVAIKAAGAKRSVITSPAYTPGVAGTVMAPGTITVNYGGIA